MIGIGLSIHQPSATSSGPTPTFALADLFSEGQAGILLEAGDTTAYFLTDAGSINVSANDDTIGLALDKRLMGGAGAETFIAAQTEQVDTANTAAAWNVISNNTVADDDGAVRITYVDSAFGGNVLLTQAGGLIADLPAGALCCITADVRVNTGSVSANMLNFVPAASQTVVETTYAPFRVTVAAGASTPTFRVTSMGTGEIAWVRNISLKIVPGNHLSQSTASFRPKHQTATSGRKYDALDDRLVSAAVCGSSGNTLAAKISAPASVGSLQAIAGLQASTSTRFYLAINTSGQLCGGVGSDGTTTIVGTTDIRGQTGSAILIEDGDDVFLYWNGDLEYSGARNDAPSTSAAFYEGALNNNGTAAAFFGGEVLDLVFRQGALDSDERTALVNYWS